MSTILKYKIIVSLEKVTTLVNDQWAFVQQMPDDTAGHDFQSWFDSHDWKLMQTDAILANITVASDGSEDFTSIMEVIQATPNNSLACFVIYIKKATYKEYVSIPQNKWNIMMVGRDVARISIKWGPKYNLVNIYVCVYVYVYIYI
jgi:hypothetical protein